MTNEPEITNKTGHDEPGVLSGGAAFPGALPNPDILEKYEKVLPGTAKKIMDIAEEQAAREAALEESAVGTDVSNSRLGLWFGFIVALIAVVGGTVAAISGHPVFGGVLGAGAMASLAGTFVYGTRLRQKDIEQKKTSVKAPSEK